jgi:hypothetical protein
MFDLGDSGRVSLIDHLDQVNIVRSSRNHLLNNLEVGPELHVTVIAHLSELASTALSS